MAISATLLSAQSAAFSTKERDYSRTIVTLISEYQSNFVAILYPVNIIFVHKMTIVTRSYEFKSVL